MVTSGCRNPLFWAAWLSRIVWGMFEADAIVAMLGIWDQKLGIVAAPAVLEGSCGQVPS